jgi:hypothetical protein
MCGSKGVETWLTRTCNCVVGAREMSCEKAASLDCMHFNFICGFMQLCSETHDTGMNVSISEFTTRF